MIGTFTVTEQRALAAASCSCLEDVEKLRDQERADVEVLLASDMAAMVLDRIDLDNDPHGERDFGAIDLHGAKWFWKIDYYANGNCDSGSEDPSDPAKCYRVLTIMHASEY